MKFLWVVLCVLLGAAVVAGCSASAEPDEPGSTSATSETSTTPASDLDGITEAIPVEARQSNGGGEPRSTGYWATWSACSDSDSAEIAANNGGAAAGWVLLDDVLESPGIAVGDLVIATCGEAVTILEQTTHAAEVGLAGAVAANVIAAEANLAAGAEWCPAAEEAVLAADVLLAAGGFDGNSVDWSDTEHRDQAQRVLELVRAYNAGDLCI